MNPRATLHAAVVLLAIFVTSLSMQAQSDSSQSNQTPPDSAKPIQVTGCLRRGNDGGFYLSDQDGRKWILSSTTVSLAQHVMHSVTVTGKPVQAVRSQIGRNPEAADSSANAARPMDVLSLKMLSPSCTRQIAGTFLLATAKAIEQAASHAIRCSGFVGTIAVNVVGSPCAPPSSAQSYVFNATVVPPGPMLFLTLWPHGTTQPTVSTLNAQDGAITSNMAVVPTNDGSIDAYAYALTQLILDISGYFAP